MGTTKVRFRVRMAGFPHMENDFAPKRADAIILGGLGTYVSGIKPPGLVRRELLEKETADKAAEEKAERKAVEREVATDRPKRGRKKAIAVDSVER